MPQSPRQTGSRAMGEKEYLAEQFYSQVSESIKLVFDLTSRIDERVKMLIERQDGLDDRLDKLIDMQQGLLNRVVILESKDVSGVKTDMQDIAKRITVIETQESPMRRDIEELKQKMHLMELRGETLMLKNQHQEGKWKTVSDFAFKIIVALAGGFMLFKFGWN